MFGINYLPSPHLQSGTRDTLTGRQPAKCRTANGAPDLLRVGGSVVFYTSTERCSPFIRSRLKCSRLILWGYWHSAGVLQLFFPLKMVTIFAMAQSQAEFPCL